jgi:hypothetical protein
MARPLPESEPRPVLHGELLLSGDVTGSHTTPRSNAPLNPAQVYLLSLNSPRSRQTMKSFLGIIARILGAAGLEDCLWGALRRHYIQAIVALLQDADKALATTTGQYGTFR